MSALPTQPLEVNDFSFGITDYFIDGDPRAAEVMDNLMLTPHKKPFTRWGSQVVSTQLPVGLLRINKLVNLFGNVLAFQDKGAYQLISNVWTEINGPGGGKFLPTGNSQSVITVSEWQEQLFFTNSDHTTPQKLYYDGFYRVVNAGLPALTSGVSITNPTGTGESYLYAVVVKQTYSVNTVQFLDRSTPYIYPTAVTGGIIAPGNTTTVTLPATLTPVENLNTSQIKLEIYRTQTNGSVFYYVGEVSLGTTTFIDNFTDAIISSNEQLYTTGGIAGNQAPPKAKYVHIVNDYGYWANILEGSERLTTEVRQSKAGDPDSVPSLFYANTEQPITGLSSIYDRPIVFCDRYVYRIDNFYGDDGSGGMLLRRIDDKAGCISQDSIVQTHLGLFWAGEDGFYWSDGFKVASISDHLNETYNIISASTNKRKNIVGTFDPSNQRVHWAVSLDDGTGEPDTVFTLDLKFPFLPNEVKHGGTFTTMSNGDNFKPTQILQIGNYFYRGDTRGFLFKHGKEFNTDPKIDINVAVNLWGTQVIPHKYASCFLDFGSKFYRKWVPRILVSAGNTTNLSLAIKSSNDNDRVTGDLKPIRYRNNITWGDSLPIWSDTTAIWNSQGIIEEWRRFPAGGLRCNYKQVKFENALVNIVDSTLLGSATVNPTANTVTLSGSFQWLADIVDYFISFEHDGYTGTFKVLSQSINTLVYEDLSGNDVPVTGMYKWILRGTPKGEVLQLNGYVIHYAMISKSHTPFSSSSTGGTP